MKNCDKSKYVCSGYRIAFDGLGSWSFGNDFARNVVIFGVDNSSSSHADNYRPVSELRVIALAHVDSHEYLFRHLIVECAKR